MVTHESRHFIEKTRPHFVFDAAEKGRTLLGVLLHRLEKSSIRVMITQFFRKPSAEFTPTRTIFSGYTDYVQDVLQ
jgi:hypothetical protein